MSTKYVVTVKNEKDGTLWGTTYNVSDFYKNLGHLDKELAIKAVRSLLEKMEQEVKDGNHV